MNQKIKDLQKIIKLKFKDETKLFQALVHRSYLNEIKDQQISSNERYEFLGDAVLELWTSDHLFNAFPQYEEGDLTNLRALIVQTQNLAKIALDINLGEFVMLSRGEETHQGRTNSSILADTLESLIGAIYLDQGYSKAAEFLKRHFSSSIKTLSEKQVFKDPKSLFQEIAQAKRGVTPHYETVSESGPDHQKIFKVAVYLEEEMIAQGVGPSKQKAQEDASIKATKILGNTV